MSNAQPSELAYPLEPRRSLTKELAKFVAIEFHHKELVQLLASAESNPTKYEEAVTLIVAQISAARANALFPGQPVSLGESISTHYKAEKANVVCWERLISDAGNLAAMLYLAIERIPKGRAAANRALRRERATQSIIALRFMLLARLYMNRAIINDTVTLTEVLPDPLQHPPTVIKKFRVAMRDYDKQVNAWHLSRGLVAAGERAGRDAAAYNVWRGDFGRARDGELGWGPFTRAARIELRYHRYKKELSHWRKRWWNLGTGLLRPLRFVRAVISIPLGLIWTLFVWIFGLVSKIALRPSLLAIMVGVTIPVFTVLYFVNGFFYNTMSDNTCTPVTWTWESIKHQFFVAIVNLTSLGGAAPECGTFTNVITAFESLTGYFLLSLLAALLFEWLFDR